MDKKYKFGDKHLRKYGWTEGSGLGKDESGIKEAIKVKIKNDKHGMGHNAGDEFTFHWWDHVFNKAASSISVQNTQDGVSLKKTRDDGPITNKKTRIFNNKEMLYGQFVKGATLADNEEIKSESNESCGEDDQEEDRQMLQKLPDEEILKICGGMTAHKGARHGLKLNGKLERIQEQEKMLLDKWMRKQTNENVSSTSAEDVFSINCDMADSVKQKKSKKKKKTDSDENEMTDVSPKENGTVVKSSKESKKKTKCKSEQSEVAIEAHMQNETDEKFLKKSKKKGKRKSEHIEMNDEADMQNEYSESSVKRSKKKKRKTTKYSESENNQTESEKIKTNENKLDTSDLHVCKPKKKCK